MSQKYLLIESRDPFDSADLPYFLNTAKDLAQQGNDVILYLIQNGVLALRRKAKPPTVQELAILRSSKVRILADDFSLRERGIEREELVQDVEISSVDALVDFLLEEKRKAVWH